MKIHSVLLISFFFTFLTLSRKQRDKFNIFINYNFIVIYVVKISKRIITLRAFRKKKLFILYIFMADSVLYT